MQNPIIDLLENCLERSGIKTVEKIETLKRNKKLNSNRFIRSSQDAVSQGLNRCRFVKKSFKGNDYQKFFINPENSRNDISFTYGEIKKQNDLNHAEDFVGKTSVIQTRTDHPSPQIIVCSTEEELREIHSKKALDPQYRCNLCGRKYSSQSVLKIHKIRHRKKEELPFPCMFCPYKSATKRDLLRHHNQHIGHARQVYKCDLCSKIFKISSSLSEHIRSVHTKETTYQCGICYFSTARRSTIRVHLKTHKKSKVKIICPICGSPFQNKSSLKNHLMTHADAKPFACSKCDKRFTVSSRLIAHQQAVHGPKSFECEICQKRFPSVHRLKRHSLTHTGEKPFKCCFCSVASNTQGNLLKHVRKVHERFHFTYKDILTESGQRDDPKKEITPDELRKLTENGKALSESHLKKFREKGLTSASLEQLQQDLKLKKEAKAAVVLKIQEKQERLKKKSLRNSSKPKEKKEREKPEKKTRQNKKKYIKGRSGSFDISNCNDFIIPRMQDGSYVIHSNDNNDGVEVLPTAPAIQVIWNVSGVDNAQKDLALSKCKRKKIVRSLSNKTKKRNAKIKSSSTCAAVINEHINLAHSSGSLNSPSNMLEDNDLTFTDKPSMLNNLHEATDFQSNNNNNNNNVLVTSLDNLHNVDHLVDFEGIESPNTVIIASDGINDFDRMYKNLDLYNQFLHISEDDAHFMNTLESAASHKEARKLVPSKNKSQIGLQDSKDKDDGKERTSLHHSVLERSSTLSPLPFHLKNNTTCRSVCTHSRNIREVLIPNAVEQVGNISESERQNYFQKDSSCLPLSANENKFPKKTKHHNKNNNSNNNDNNNKQLQKRLTICTLPNTECNFKTTTNSCHNLSPIKNLQKGTDKMQHDEIIILYDCNGQISRKVSSQVSIHKDTSSQPMREITIKNSLSNYTLINDELDVMAIAEVEENENEVVLVIDSLS